MNEVQREFQRKSFSEKPKTNNREPDLKALYSLAPHNSIGVMSLWKTDDPLQSHSFSVAMMAIRVKFVKGDILV